MNKPAQPRRPLAADSSLVCLLSLSRTAWLPTRTHALNDCTRLPTSLQRPPPQDEAGWWDPSASVAYAIGARKIHPEDVAHLVRGKGQAWRNICVLFGTEGEIDRADQNVEGVRGNEARTAESGAWGSPAVA